MHILQSKSTFSSKISQSVFSQRDRRFGASAGKQCVAMSLTSIVHNQTENASIWNSSSLNNILLNGDSLCTCICNSVGKDLLLLTGVPEIISAYGKIYNLQYSQPYAGAVSMPYSDEPYFSLEDSFRKYFYLLN